MTSVFKTAHITSSSKTNIKPIFSRNLPLLGACVAMSMFVGCASVDKAPEADAASNIQTKAEIKSEMEIKAEAQELQKDSAAKADLMMDSLKGPVTEPGQQKVSADEAKKTVEKVTVKVKAPVQAKVEVVEKAVVAVKSEAPKVELVAKAPVAAKVVKKTVVRGSAKPLAISAKDLPASYDIWVLKNGDTPLTNGLVISTPTWEMGKEGYMSQIWLTFKDDELHINSSSDIATEAKGLGIRIDGGELIPFSRIAENNIGIVSGDWLDTLAAANNLDIYLGFFPGKKPSSETFKSSTSLENLDRVVATYRKLSQ